MGVGGSEPAPRGSSLQPLTACQAQSLGRADSVIRVHSRVSNGGFDDVLSEPEISLDKAAEDYESFGLSDLARVVRSVPLAGSQAAADGGAGSGLDDTVEALSSRYFALTPPGREPQTRIVEYWREHPNEAPPELAPDRSERSIPELASDYASLAAIEGEAARSSFFRGYLVSSRIYELYRALRETDGGREALSRLLEDKRQNVRCSAAIHAYQWEGDRSLAVLRDLAAGDGPVAGRAAIALGDIDSLQ